MYEMETFNLYAMENEGLLSTKESKAISLIKEVLESDAFKEELEKNKENEEISLEITIGNKNPFSY